MKPWERDWGPAAASPSPEPGAPAPAAQKPWERDWGAAPPATAPKAQVAQVQPPTSGVGEVVKAFADPFVETGHQMAEAARDASKQMKSAAPPKLSQLGPTPSELRWMGDELAIPGALFSGPLTSILGRPAETLTGGRVKKQDVGEAASLALPFAQEAVALREGGALAKALGTTEKAARNVLESGDKIRKIDKLGADPYRDAVDLLRQEGVFVTPGRQRGRYAKRVEEGWKSSAHAGHGIREAERDSLIDLNRAFYNRALKPIGEQADKSALSDAKIGNEGIAYVEQRLDEAYKRVKPHVKFQRDDEFVKGVEELRKEGSTLPEVQREHFGRLLTQHVEPALHAGNLDGEQFQRVDSFLGKHAGLLKKEGGYMAEEGRLLEDLQGLMRDNIERHSDKSITKQLKAVNKGWAQYVRLRTAAANRSKSDGIFTPGDILTAIKREDKSVGKGAFAKGEALLQDLARAGNRVLSDVVPDSGTAERSMQMHRGLGGFMLGGMLGHDHVLGALTGGALDFLSAPYTNRGSHALMHALGKVEPVNPRLAAGAPTPPRQPNLLPMTGAAQAVVQQPDDQAAPLTGP